MDCSVTPQLRENEVKRKKPSGISSVAACGKKEPIKDLEQVRHKTSHGNTLRVQFEYPEENPNTFVSDITDALTYIGIFDGIKTPKQNDA